MTNHLPFIFRFLNLLILIPTFFALNFIILLSFIHKLVTKLLYLIFNFGKIKFSFIILNIFNHFNPKLFYLPIHFIMKLNLIELFKDFFSS
jgi:hypothetical protein